jgi:hypothetical protein
MHLLFLLSVVWGVNVFCMDGGNELSDIQQLFSAISHHNYEKSAELIRKQPELVDTQALYDKQHYLYAKLTPVHVAAFERNDNALAQCLAVSKTSVNHDYH